VLPPALAAELSAELSKASEHTLPSLDVELSRSPARLAADLAPANESFAFLEAPSFAPALEPSPTKPAAEVFAFLMAPRKPKQSSASLDAPRAHTPEAPPMPPPKADIAHLLAPTRTGSFVRSGPTGRLFASGAPAQQQQQRNRSRSTGAADVLNAERDRHSGEFNRRSVHEPEPVPVARSASRASGSIRDPSPGPSRIPRGPRPLSRGASLGPSDLDGPMRPPSRGSSLDLLGASARPPSRGMSLGPEHMLPVSVTRPLSTGPRPLSRGESLVLSPTSAERAEAGLRRGTSLGPTDLFGARATLDVPDTFAGRTRHKRVHSASDELVAQVKQRRTDAPAHARASPGPGRRYKENAPPSAFARALDLEADRAFFAPPELPVTPLRARALVPDEAAAELSPIGKEMMASVRAAAARAPRRRGGSVLVKLGF
jgi:hypothetical protein